MNNHLLQRYQRDLVLTGFSVRTQKTYYRNLAQNKIMLEKSSPNI